MESWNDIQQAIVKFRDARDWKQFHNPKDLPLALSIEVSELNELFLLKKAEEADLNKVKSELADILSYALLLADAYELDIPTIFIEKLEQSGKKYPVAYSGQTDPRSGILTHP